ARPGRHRDGVPRSALRRGQGPGAGLRGPLHRPPHRRGELRDRPRRGHGLRRPGPRERPRRLPPRPRRGAGRDGRGDLRHRAAGGPLRPGARARPRPGSTAGALGPGARAVAGLRLADRRRGGPRGVRDRRRRRAWDARGHPAAAGTPGPTRRWVMEVLGWGAVVVSLLLVLAWYLSYSAARLDRLHAKVEGALSALDAPVVRRAEASLELANSGAVDPASGVLIAAAATESLERHNERTFEADLLEGQHFAGRETVESELSEALHAALPPEVTRVIAAEG